MKKIPAPAPAGVLQPYVEAPTINSWRCVFMDDEPNNPEELQKLALEARAERDAARQENRRLSRELVETKERVDKYSTTITQLGNGMSRLEERYNELAEKHKANIEEFHKMKAMRDEARAEVELLQQDLEEAREEVRVVESRESTRKSQDILFLVRRLRYLSERDV